jgi:hypothetical protein
LIRGRALADRGRRHGLNFSSKEAGMRALFLSRRDRL